MPGDLNMSALMRGRQREALLTAKARREADGAIGGLDLKEERPKHVDAPACPRGPVFFPL